METNLNMLYNLEELRSSASGDDAFVAEMVKLFISQNEAALPEIRNHLACKDYASVKAILHKIKPSVIVMGVNTAAEIINNIEQMELSAFDGSSFSDQCLKFEMILLEVNEQLRGF